MFNYVKSFEFMYFNFFLRVIKITDMMYNIVYSLTSEENA